MTPDRGPCPMCKKGDVVFRMNKRTGMQFAGCTQFPACKWSYSPTLPTSPLGSIRGPQIDQAFPVRVSCLANPKPEVK